MHCVLAGDPRRSDLAYYMLRHLFFALYVSLSNYQIVRLYYLWVGGVIPGPTYLSTEQVCSH